MGHRTSVYLSNEAESLLKFCGNPPLGELIVEACTARLSAEAEAGYPVEKMKQRKGASAPLCPPHPKGRVTKGFCGLCGHQVGTGKIT
jgi:hypothetical protein